MTRLRSAGEANVIWHDVECGAYVADLELWAELAAKRAGPLLELGCGTGRVGLWLARRRQRVVGLDVSRELVEEFNRRAEGLPAGAVAGEAADLQLRERFGLVIAPMQLIQLLADRERRRRCLGGVRDRLAPEGIAAFAVVEELPELCAGESAPAIPDVRERDGWIYSSLPLPTEVEEERLVLRRLRQVVGPHGAIEEELDELALSRLSAAELEREAAAVGLRALGRRRIPATDAHVGSTVVIVGREA